jgi:HEAT repeat protein
MELNKIEAYLGSNDSQERLKAIVELRNYESPIAVPLLLTKVSDREFIVRSYVAMGLGRKRSEAAFSALLDLVKCDRDSNVRSEAANSLSFYGEVAIPYLVEIFHRDEHWLVRRSILAALTEFNCPEALFEVCACGLEGEDPTVREASISTMVLLAGTNKHNDALEKLLSLVDSPSWSIRASVAKTLGKFNDAIAQTALMKLRQDEDSRVIGAVLENLL